MAAGHLDIPLLEEHLSTRSYVYSEVQATHDDFKLLGELPELRPERFPHIDRWQRHLFSLKDIHPFKQWPSARSARPLSNPRPVPSVTVRKLLDGSTVSIDAQSLRLVADLRQAVARSLSAKPSSMRIVLADRVLQDSTALDDLESHEFGVILVQDWKERMQESAVALSAVPSEVSQEVLVHVKANLSTGAFRDRAQVRLKKEMAVAMHSSMPNIAIVEGSDLFHWRALISGPSSTAYENRLFELHVFVPDDYPFAPPVVYCATKIFHANVSPLGMVCPNGDFLTSDWSPAFTIHKVLLAIVSILADPSPFNPANSDAASLLVEDPLAYEATAREWAEKYAG